MSLELVMTQDGKSAVIHARGEIDAVTSPTLRAGIDRVARAGFTDVIIDLTQVTFLDSTAIGVLVGRLKALRQLGGSLTVASPTPRVQRLFEVTAVDQLLMGPVDVQVATGQIQAS